jgi:hypothetical protein
MLVKPEAPNLYGVKRVAYTPYETLTQWVSDFEAYFVANLGQKRRLIQLNNWIGYRILGDLQSDNVLVGKHGWLFLKQNFGWESMRSEAPLTEHDARAWRRSLEEGQKWLARRKIPFLFVIVPAKETIYPELLPASAPHARAVSRLDEMLELLQGTRVNYLELRTPLREARNAEQLYDTVDSHWNGRGATIGAELVMKRVAELLGRPAAFAELDSELHPRPSWADMPMILSLDDVVTAPSVELVPRHPRARRVEPPESIRRELTRKEATRMIFEVPDDTLPKALILRDSFSEGFMPTLSEKFRRTAWLWTHDFDLRMVATEEPDIVIWEMTERFLSGSPPPLRTPRR